MGYCGNTFRKVQTSHATIAEKFKRLPMHSTTGPANHSGGEHRRKCLPTNYTQAHDTVLRRPVESALTSGVRMMDRVVEWVALSGAVGRGVAQRALDETGVLAPRALPARDQPGVGVDDERGVAEPAHHRHVGEVGHDSRFGAVTRHCRPTRSGARA